MSGRACSAAWAVFFARDAVSREEAAQRAVAELKPHRDQAPAQFLGGEVGRRREFPKDRRLVRVDPPGPAVSAKSLRPRIALLAFAPAPPAHARRAHTEAFANLAMGETLPDRGQHTNPKIDRQSFRHACRPPAPADSLNHPNADRESPSIHSVRRML